MTRAERKATREQTHAAAVATGDRAYTFMDAGKGELLEVRVWPDGRFTHTRCDLRGMPIAEPKEPFASRLATLEFRAHEIVAAMAGVAAAVYALIELI